MESDNVGRITVAHARNIVVRSLIAPLRRLTQAMSNRDLNRQLRHYFRLNYPVQMVMKGDRFYGEYPDLPGCKATHRNPQDLYFTLDQRRRSWLADRVLRGEHIPSPGSLQSEPSTSLPAPDSNSAPTPSA